MHLTQERLAEKSGLSVNTIRNLEKEDGLPPIHFRSLPQR
ncbi:helix-turn-helix domain-containing protein [uncultured Treponema sp.]